MSTFERREVLSLALAQVKRDATIQSILEVEPTFQQALDLAAHPSPDHTRWVCYEALKRLSRNLVGWQARHPNLRTSQHYEAMIWAIDLILPTESEELPNVSPYDERWHTLIDAFREKRRVGDWSLWRDVLEEGA